MVEQDLEYIPVLQVTHTESHHGREYQILQRVGRNLLTDFDRKLSWHLAAVQVIGLPAFSVAVEVQEASGIELLDAAVGTCRHLGEAEFLQIAGDTDNVMITPPGDLKPVIMQL